MIGIVQRSFLFLVVLLLFPVDSKCSSPDSKGQEDRFSVGSRVLSMERRLKNPRLPEGPLPKQAPVSFQANSVPSPQSYPGSATRNERVRYGCQQVPPSGRVRVLAIDGGGVRGLIPATVVAQLEKDLSLPITEVFDVFVGNSAGGMLALLLTKEGKRPGEPEFTAGQIVEIIKSFSAKIFGGVSETVLDRAKATLRRAKNVLTTGAQYSPEALEKFAADIYGHVTISQSVRPVFIATFDLNSETTQILSTPLAKRSKLFDFKVSDIARATSAAPFYFPVYPLEFMNAGVGTGLKMQLIDGGVGSNNPTLIGLIDISREYCTVPSFEILSLGTGTAKSHFEKLDMQRKGVPLMMLKPTIGAFMSAQSQNADEVTKSFLNLLNTFSGRQNNYTRLQVYLDEQDEKLDDVRKQTTANLTQKAQEIIGSSKYKQLVERLRKQLCDEGIYKKQKKNIHSEVCSTH